jgi:hypothetical protein
VLIGALFSEMVLAKKIHLEDGRLVVGPGAFGDPWFDEILTIIASEQKSRKLNHWLDNFDTKQMLNKLAERLAERKVITIDKKHYIWIIPCDVYPNIIASGKYSVKQHLRSIGLAGEKADLFDIALLNILKECRLLSLVFTPDERKYVSMKITAMSQDEVLGETDSKLMADIKELSEAVATFINT